MKNKRCKALGCMKNPSFGVEPKVAKWCAAHAPEEASNVVSKRCEASVCTKFPSFGVEPRVARWCAAHAPEEAWDVMSKRCEALGCTKNPSFGLRGERKRRWCAAHAPTEVINLAPDKKEVGGTSGPDGGRGCGRALSLSDLGPGLIGLGETEAGRRGEALTLRGL